MAAELLKPQQKAAIVNDRAMILWERAQALHTLCRDGEGIFPLSGAALQYLKEARGFIDAVIVRDEKEASK